jgi:hypothetical protein
MTENKVALLVLKDTISEMEQEDQDKINAYAGQIQDILDDSKDNGEPEYGQLAITLIGLKTAVAMGA